MLNRMFRGLIVIATVLVAFASGCVTRHSSSSSEAALALSYEEFDQTPGSGWRVLAENGKRYPEAARLIEKYLTQHRELNLFQRVTLHWHAGQLWAFDGNNNKALHHLAFARLDPEPPNHPLRWNDYVEATVAFLEGDRAKLLAARNRMAAKSPNDANLPIVNSLVANFGVACGTAYRANR